MHRKMLRDIGLQEQHCQATSETKKGGDLWEGARKNMILLAEMEPVIPKEFWEEIYRKKGRCIEMCKFMWNTVWKNRCLAGIVG